MTTIAYEISFKRLFLYNNNKWMYQQKFCKYFTH